MQLIRQPDGESLCGQACVAMAAHTTLAAAIRAVGHRRQRGTHTWELVAALAVLGVSCAPRLQRAKHVAGIPVLPPCAIIAIRRDGSKHRWHWMIWCGVVLDPAGLWPAFYGSDWRITSFLQIHNSGAPLKSALYFPQRCAVIAQRSCGDVRERTAVWQRNENEKQQTCQQAWN